jgi:hypothetical protein
MAAPLAVLGMGSTLLGGITQAQGAQAEGKAQLEQNYYQAGVAKLNADIAKQDEAFALNKGEQEAQIAGLRGGQQLGQIKAAQASGNIDVNSGSALAVQKGQKMAIDLDRAQITSNAAMAAYDYNAKATQFENQSTLYEMAGTNAAQAGQIKAESSILGTAGSVAAKWSQGSQVGLFNDVGSSIGSAVGFDPFVGL